MKQIQQVPAVDSRLGFSAQLGEHARAARKAQRLSIRAAAEQLQCSPRFVHELERGKPTARMDKVLQALSGLGLQLSVSARPADHDARVRARSIAQVEARSRQDLYEEKLARAHERIAAMLALDAIDPGTLEQARGQVRKWADQQICSQWYVDRWSGILAGTGAQIARKILALDKQDAKALFQNTPFGFLVLTILRE
jgi:transcriptional regulator with XRE-family HTH domain